MPNRKRPGGRRQAANFDPRYARKKPNGPRGSRKPYGDRRRSDDDHASSRGETRRSPRYDRFDGDRETGRRTGASRGYRDRKHHAPREGAAGRPRGDGERSGRPAASARYRGERGSTPSRDHDRRRAGDRMPRRFREGSGRVDHEATKSGDRGAAGSYNGRKRPAAARTGYQHTGRQHTGRQHTSRQRSAPERTAPEPVSDTVLERLQATAQDASTTDATFAELGLGANIVAALEKLGASTPFPIQAATIPDIIAGRDLLGRGRTGSGKTIAFGAGTVERLMNLWAARDKSTQKRSFGRAPRALMLAPTRELALQLDRTVQPLARSVGLFTTQVYGGVPQGRQVGALKRGVDIVIGTPGRIEDLVAQGHLDLSQVVISVIDEADHMSELGFIEPVQRILRLTDPGAQRLLFSATLDTQVASVIDEFLTDPAVHEVASDDSGTIDHQMLVIDHRQKLDVIEELARREGKVLVFARTRNYTDQLATMLDERGIPAVSLHGDIKQAKRQRNLDKLARGSVRVLVATDVAARGIHVDDVQLVVQADAPTEYKAYLHRAGRTGRAGHDGTVITLVTKARKRALTELLSRAEVQASVSYAERS